MTCLKARCKIHVNDGYEMHWIRETISNMLSFEWSKGGKKPKTWWKNLTWRYFANTLLSKSIQIVVAYCCKFPSKAFEIKITILKFLFLQPSALTLKCISAIFKLININGHYFLQIILWNFQTTKNIYFYSFFLMAQWQKHLIDNICLLRH